MIEEVERSVELVGDGFRSFATGASVRGQFQCTECGYGVAVHGLLPSCPMCAGTGWTRVSPAGVRRSSARLV